MRGIDTINIVTPLEVVQRYNDKLFNDLPTFDAGSGDLIAHRYRLKTSQNPHLGLNQVEMNTGTGELRLSLSAKILREDYHKLINLNTIERVFDEINNSGVISLDKGRSINEAGVQLCDITQNIPKHPDYSVQEFNSVLKLASIGSGFNPNTPKGSDTLILAKRGRWFTSYNKQRELNTSKAVKQFGGLHDTVVNTHKDLYRIEEKLKNFNQIRNAFDVRAKDVPPLTQVLNSEQRPLLKTFNELTKSSVQLDAFLSRYNDDLDWLENKDLFGLYYILETHDCDLDRVRETIRQKAANKNRTTQYRYFKEVQAALILYQQRELKGSQSAKKHPILEYIRTYLKAA